jgi:hypothetical protein
MATFADLVHQTSLTTGTGNFTLVALNGKQSFNAAFGTGSPNQFYYFISNQSAVEWEVGTGHLSAPSVLLRDTVIASSNANALVNFSGGTKDVTNAVPAEHLPPNSIVDASGNTLVTYSAVASAVNYWQIQNAATGNPPSLYATGGNANVSLEILTRQSSAAAAQMFIGNGVSIGASDLVPGQGNLGLGSGNGIYDNNANKQLVFLTTASAVNYLQIQNAATEPNAAIEELSYGFPTISAQGSDSNIGVTVKAKGAPLYGGVWDLGTVGGGTLRLTTEANVASGGPALELFYNKNGAAANQDVVSYITYAGKNSAGSWTQYGYFAASIDSTTAGAESGYYYFVTTRAGNTSKLQFFIGDGVSVGPSEPATWPGQGNLLVTGQMTAGAAAQTLAGSGGINLYSASTGGPFIVPWHNKGTPAANDYPFQINAYGNSSTGVKRNLAEWDVRYIDPTNAAESACWEAWVSVAGSHTNRMSVGNGLILGNSTTFPGDGNIALATGKGIYDENAHAQLVFSTTASAVNYLQIQNAATGNPPNLYATGSNANVSLEILTRQSSAAAAQMFIGSGVTIGTTDQGPGQGALKAAAGITSIGPTSGVGYATGAGGAVTQITSRTTGVTLNTVTGAITLVSAAGSATPATFTLTNSAIAATDVIIFNQKSGTDKYEIFVTAVGAGSCNVTFFTTGGTTTEQPVFNFAVIKGAAS